MYLALIVAAVLMVLLALLLTVRRRHTEVLDVRSAEEAMVAVDVEAFRNLIDPAQDRFLRSNLTRRDYRRVQRARYLAAAEYLRQVAFNAGIILRLGESVSASHEPSEVKASELVAAAASVRLHCLMALFHAYAGVLFPGVAVSIATVADSYDRLTMQFWAVGRSLTPIRSAS